MVARDRSQFEEVFRDHYDAVLSYALARADADMAKDVAADTFLVAWRRWQEIPDAVRPWLLGVARRALADQRRSAVRQRAVTDRLSTAGERPVDPPDPADEVVERSVIRAALRRLRARDREVLCLVSWDGLSPGEAAEVLGCSRLGFAVRLHRARRRLEAALAVEQSPGEPPGPNVVWPEPAEARRTVEVIASGVRRPDAK